jgi:hypothetical protein
MVIAVVTGSCGPGCYLLVCAPVYGSGALFSGLNDFSD